MTKFSNTELKTISYDLKKLVLTMLNQAGSGHTGAALGLSDIFAVLYGNVLNVSSAKPHLKSRDYLFLSNGHTCPILYATLAYFNFFDKKELLTLRQINSRLQGHPHLGALPGVENSGGPLGQGISQAVGLAAALKRDNKKNWVFCIVGDGECEEGQVWEALLFANKEQLDNLIIIVDKNDVQIDGSPKEVIGFDQLVSKFQSFGCVTTEFNGNNISQIKTVIEHAKQTKGKPHVLIANTTLGSGVSFIENRVEWHGKVPNDEELEVALHEVNYLQEQLK